MIIGLIGSTIASILLCLGYNLILEEMTEAGLVFFSLIPFWPFMSYVSLFILASGIIIGALGSAISLRKYMKV